MTSYAVATLAFFSAFGGVFLAGIALVVVVRVQMSRLVLRDVQSGRPCAICKQKQHLEPVDEALLDFFLRLPNDQVHAFCDALDDMQRKRFEQILERIWRARAAPASRSRSPSRPPPGKDCH